MLAQDIPPPLSEVGSQQRRTRATSKPDQLDHLVSFGLVKPDARKAKKRRNVEFAASTDTLGESITSSPPQRPILSQTHRADVVLPQLAIREDPRAIRKTDTGNPSRQHSKNQSLDQRKPTDNRPERHPSIARLQGQRNSMLAAKGRESRRERTFIGSHCAACEEPLEHTLRGERILQLSCGHVAHEACFYEYIKEFEVQSCPTCDAPLGLDPSRGTGIDFENLNKLVRSAQAPEPRDTSRDTQATPTPSSWHPEATQMSPQSHTPRAVPMQQRRNTREHLLPERARTNPAPRHERYDSSARGHGRNTSGDTGMVSTIAPTDYAETQHTRRQDYDAQSMRTSSSAGRRATRNPIPAPTVTVRSEFPTLSKSRQQQSLTCLVTVEAVDGKWQANPEDMRAAASTQCGPEDMHSKSKSIRSQEQHRPIDSIHEGYNYKESLENLKQDLFKRVDNWHGLDVTRFGRLIIHGTIRVGKDRQSWQELECYLFEEMLICVKEKKLASNESQHWDGADPASKGKGKCTLKGSILIKKHLKDVEYIAGTSFPN